MTTCHDVRLPLIGLLVPCVALRMNSTAVMAVLLCRYQPKVFNAVVVLDTVDVVYLVIGGD